MTMIAKGHSSFVALPPYPIVCWVSNENKKQEVKSIMASPQGTKFSLLRFSGSKSPWTQKVRYQSTAKANHDNKKDAAKMTLIHIQFNSIMEMKKSPKNLL